MKKTSKKKGQENKIRRNKKRGRRKWRVLCLLALLIFAAVGIARFRESRRAVPSWVPMNGEYPVSMLEFMEKYPQATDFVMNFPEKKGLHEPIDISAEMAKGGIPLFIQWDERWGYEMYGDDFLGVNGCGPTSLAMVRCGLGGDAKWNPYEVAKMAEENGYYVSGVGSSWDLMTEGANALGLTAYEVPYSAQGIIETLQSGKVIICSMGPGEFTYSGHFIVLTGVDEDGQIFLNDSNSRERSEKTWDADYLLSQMAGMWAYSF